MSFLTVLAFPNALKLDSLIASVAHLVRPLQFNFLPELNNLKVKFSVTVREKAPIYSCFHPLWRVKEYFNILLITI
jgi:hypothetical protein